MKTFKHSGDMGDIIFSLPTIRALGGGVLYLDPNGGKDEPLVHGTDQGDTTKLSAASIESMTDLLIEQPYVQSVVAGPGTEAKVNLDKFRDFIKFNNLADSHLAAFGFGQDERDEAWLTCGKNFVKPRVIARSCRYQGNHAFWGHFTQITNMEECVFLGHPLEHQLFEHTFNVKVEYKPTKTLMDAAEIINAAEEVNCNQNVLHAITEGLKKKVINEVFRVYPAAVFKRDDATYV